MKAHERLIRRLTAAALAVGVAILVFAACSGRPHNGNGGQPDGLVNQPDGPVNQPQWLVNLQAAEPPQSVTDALAELDALACPKGVDTALWGELKAALEAALHTKSILSTPGSPARLLAGLEEQDGHSMLCPYKSVATPPTGEANRVNDFGLADHGDGSYTLTWHYRNLGDYAQDGAVGISDITPLAQHFGQTYDPEAEPHCIQAVIDGSGNGKVDIADVTPIAVHFGIECAAYSIRRSSSYPEEIDDTTELDIALLEPEQWEERRFFSRIFALPPYTYIAVAPVDAEGVPGELSNVRYTPNHQPVAALVADPAEGDAPLTVNLDASESYDPDGPMAKYEWDWEGDGVWDEDTGAAPVAQHVYDIADYYYPVVRVTDSSGATATAEATVFAGQWRITTAVTALLGETGPTSLEIVDGNPAISFWGDIAYVLFGEYWFVRANDSLGSEWRAPVNLYDLTDGGFLADCPLILANGRPAVGLVDGTSSRLYYTQSVDNEGTAWGTPLEVSWGSAGGNILSMAIVDGRPAIALGDVAVFYIRALDADGTAWGTPVKATYEGHKPSLAVVNGNPAISYGAPGGLWYVRANDAGGETWGAPVVVDAGDGDFPGDDSSLAVVNGKPAIAYETAVYIGPPTYWLDMVEYVIANDENGVSWGNPRTLAEDARLGYDKSLAVINGRPAICYLGFSDSSLRYICAADADGSTWRAPVIISTDFVRVFSPCLNSVNGHPAISYFAGTGCTELRFAIYY